MTGNNIISPEKPAYRSTVHVAERRCKGHLSRNIPCSVRIQGERYHEKPTGKAPFIEVPCWPVCNFMTGEVTGHAYTTTRLVGFCDPFTEFLAEDEVLGLFDSLDLLSTKQAGEVLGCSARYLEKLRRLGQGPRFWRIADGSISYAVRYERFDLEAYVLERETRPERRGGQRNRGAAKGVDHRESAPLTPFENVSEQIYDV